MRRPNREALLWLVLVGLLAAPLRYLSTSIMGDLGLDRPYDIGYLPRSDAFRLLSPAIRLTVADMYWLATVQYIGERKARERGWDKLYPLVDLITDLDPGHGYAYQTAGISLSAEGRLDESDRILKKGMQKGRPNWWTYPFYLAFNAFFYRGDYPEAARWAEIAARTPGASTNISHLALALKVKEGSPEDAVRFLEEMRSQAHDEKTAQKLEDQYKIALLQRDFALLDEAVARFAETRGRAPSTLDEVVAAGLLPRVPQEPFDGKYYLDPKDGKVHSSGKDFRFRPPEKPRAPLASPPKPP